MQTAKGLHFPSSQFASIKRTGFLSAAAERFQAAVEEDFQVDLSAVEEQRKRPEGAPE